MANKTSPKPEKKQTKSKTGSQTREPKLKRLTKDQLKTLSGGCPCVSGTMTTFDMQKA